MEGKMKAAYLTETNKMEIREAQIPPIGDGDVLIRVMDVGICGSDLHFYQHGRIGDFVVEFPFILGHEAGGEVVETGGGVTGLKVGDKVAVEPGIPCGTCEACREGKYNLCPDVRFWAAPPVNGCMQEYVSFPANMCFKIPEGMTTLEAAMIEPLSVGLHAVSKSGYRMGDTAVVLGCGCIGLCTMLALKAAGVTDVIVSDVVDARLEKAKKLGATAVVNAAKEDIREAVMRLTGGRGADLVFETAGAKPTVQATVHLVKRGGTIVMVGMGSDAVVDFDMGALVFNEITICSVFRYRNLYPAAIKLVSSGAINIKDVVTDIFPFDECDKAFRACVENKDTIVKGAVKF